ncbi:MULTISPECIES: helix-turn-helix transcriptional regulator [Streptomyces]|uniref:helix-turn-helix domain-containing protein n=1 Tax=Streptomyces TaxID=1883 RepID=UPI0022EE4D7D|nr:MULTISPECIES: helix-turn-helix transcriptional regulator [Streptomyces]WFB88110.1 helix-turn-helix domain-containing protein [Streptomyces olivaceus]WGK47713.1 helix-turn-helix domain-containing protein [Streptomyces sp. B146]GHI91908.1 transcriptional regulator [Streptomyces olivaceus]
MAGDDFAGLLRELKERSGLSYGALGKRLHMSGSTLHRYVNGEVVPVEFAPVERLARACRATPGELLELHRRWIRADALRGVKKGEESEEGAGKDGTVTDGTVKEEAVAENEGDGPGEEEGTAPAPPASPAPPTAPAVPDAPLVRDAPTAVTAPAAPAPPRRRVPRVALYAATGVVAVSAAVALALNLLADPDEKEDHGPAGAVAQNSAPESEAATGSPSPSRSASSTPSGSPSSSPSPSRTQPSGPDAAPPGSEAPPEGPALTVATTPYHWDSPCEQQFLVDRSPQNVPPPPAQQDVAGWAGALGGVAADRQMTVLTVQGTGADTVVLENLHVRVVDSGKPLGWKKYAMGTGCGGGANSKSFDVSLDLGNPLATPVAGQKDFPYKVSESDPEVFYVNAHTSGHDVSWYLELEWSRGGQKGTTRIDNQGKPFRTSAAEKAYWYYPLGGGDSWEYSPGG